MGLCIAGRARRAGGWLMRNSLREYGKEYPHGVVDHAKDQYVIGAVHTQTIEGFWSIIKRDVLDAFHKISNKYMLLYVTDFQFRYQSRENVDIFGAAIFRC
jgi:hypothetical protein